MVFYIFDSNCAIGPTSENVGGTFQSARSLLDEMDRLGIGEALVYHTIAKEVDPELGNSLVEEMTREDARIHGCWVLLPTIVHELSGNQVDSLIDRMLERGIKAVRLFPSRHRYPLSSWCLGSLLRALERRRVPVFIDFEPRSWSDPAVDWDGLYRICTGFPDLPVVLVHEGIAGPRKLYPLWKTVHNLYIETSYYQVHRGFEDICEKFGPERLIFGTGMPTYDPSLPLNMLLSSNIGEAEKKLIAGGNLRKLLSGVIMPELVAFDTLLTAFGREIKAELPRILAVDSHAHLGRYSSTYMPYSTEDGLIETMDRLGIEKACISDFLSIGPDYRRGNDRVAHAVRRYPTRFVGYVAVNPNYPDDMENELERCFREPGMKGIKLHCDLHSYPIDGDNYRPALEFANSRSLPVLIHGYGDRRTLEGILRRYPDARIIAAHVGAWDGRSSNPAIELAKDYENLYLDLASSIAYRGAFEKMVERVGADRILYGSDMPMLDPGYQLGRVVRSGIPKEQMRMILSDNARKLFGLPD